MLMERKESSKAEIPSSSDDKAKLNREKRHLLIVSQISLQQPEARCFGPAYPKG
jgi:hypothetical protein